MLKLDLGCGKVQEEGWIGLDMIEYGHNIKWTAGDRIPYDMDSVDQIRANNFLEHIERKLWIPLFNECWRVLKRGTGQMEFVVPNAERSIDLAMGDPTHVSLWVRQTLKYLNGERPRYSSIGLEPWDVIVCEELAKEPRCDRVVLRPRKPE